jgi:hypothetical protein
MMATDSVATLPNIYFFHMSLYVKIAIIKTILNKN